MMIASEQIEQVVRDRFPSAVEEAEEIRGVATLHVNRDAIFDICDFLKQTRELGFDYLMSLSAIDLPERFDVVYHLYSIAHKHYVTLKVKLDKDQGSVQSVAGVWKAANWQEREVFDMFGISFEGHPDLRRILLDPDWDGFPLRKDYTRE